MHNLSVHCEHLSASFVCSQNRSGYIWMHTSHTSHTANAITKSDTAKKLPKNSIGVNIIR